MKVPTTITKRLEFDYGHRLVGHESKCAHYHGHRGAVEVTVEAEALDGVGRVIDFSAIKSEFGTWLDETFDHAMLLRDDDPLLARIAWPNEAGADIVLARVMDTPLPNRIMPLRSLVEANGFVALHAHNLSPAPNSTRVVVLRDNPTAEHLAAILLDVADALMRPWGVRVVALSLYETPTSKATVTR